MTHNTSDNHSGGEGDWETEFVEKGAGLEHARWARWQNYLHSSLTWNNELQAWVLPHEKKAHWQRQIETYYGALSEKEKESDRKEVAEYLPLVRTEKSKSYQEGVASQKLALTLLKVAKCPECDGSGAYYVGSNDDPDVQQCQWCDERKTLLTPTNTV